MGSSNVKAMRDALLNIQEYAAAMDVDDGNVLAILDACRDALSAPARNCDRFADDTDAQIAFLNEVWLISVDRETMLARDKYENWSDEMRTRYGKWLLAPAAEKKGKAK